MVKNSSGVQLADGLILTFTDRLSTGDALVMRLGFPRYSFSQGRLVLTKLIDCQIGFSFVQTDVFSGKVRHVRDLTIRVSVSRLSPFTLQPAYLKFFYLGNCPVNHYVFGKLDYDPIGWLYTACPDLVSKIHTGPEAPGKKLLELTGWHGLEIEVSGFWYFERWVDGKSVPNELRHVFLTTLAVAEPVIELNGN